MPGAIRLCLGAWILGLVWGVTLLSAQEPPEETGWRKHVINDRSPFEAVGVADLNRDGVLDVFSGDSWYAGPRWTRHQVRTVPPGTNPQYHEDFADAPLDVNGDGRIDIVTCAYFSQRVGWIENPADPTQPWTEHLIDRPGSMETGYLRRLFADAPPVFLPNVGGQVLWYEPSRSGGAVRWEVRQLAPTGAGHGLGDGDVNGDGRLDLVTPKGWYEQPANRAGDWTFHPEFTLGTASIEILVYDCDGDGKSDIVWGQGHDFGLQWLRQTADAGGARGWTRGEIDTSFSQVHTLQLGDFDGDGRQEFATGKRIYAHAAEPGATDKPCLYLFRYGRDPAGRPVAGRWTREVIHEGRPAENAPADARLRDALVDFPRGSAGTGLRMAVEDLDRDGDLDLVTPGKSGLYWFENTRRQTPQ